MTEEQIKKAVELAEGFEWFENQNGLHIDFLEYSGTFLKDVNTWYLYPLLLYRAKDGWNSTRSLITDKLLSVDHEAVDIFTENNYNKRICGSYFDFDNYPTTPYLTTQEQALEAALEGVLA